MKGMARGELGKLKSLRLRLTDSVGNTISQGTTILADMTTKPHPAAVLYTTEAPLLSMTLPRGDNLHLLLDLSVKITLGRPL
jgi:hypothetical protein